MLSGILVTPSVLALSSAGSPNRSTFKMTEIILRQGSRSPIERQAEGGDDDDGPDDDDEVGVVIAWSR